MRGVLITCFVLVASITVGQKETFHVKSKFDNENHVGVLLSYDTSGNNVGYIVVDPGSHGYYYKIVNKNYIGSDSMECSFDSAVMHEIVQVVTSSFIDSVNKYSNGLNKIFFQIGVVVMGQVEYSRAINIDSISSEPVRVKLERLIAILEEYRKKYYDKMK